MDNQKEELLSILKDIASSDFFSKEEKEGVQQLAINGNKKICELIKLLRKYLVTKSALGIKNLTK